MYELMVAGRADDADSLFSKLEKIVKDANASSVSSQKLGKKPLAYPIKKQTEGQFFVLSFEAPPEAVAAISESLKLEQEQILRYLLTKVKERKGKKAAKGPKESKDGQEVTLARQGQKVENVEKPKAVLKKETKEKKATKSKRA